MQNNHFPAVGGGVLDAPCVSEIERFGLSGTPAPTDEYRKGMSSYV